MYPFILDKRQMGRLYELREGRKKKGEKVSMAGFVREAVNQYLDKNETKKTIKDWREDLEQHIKDRSRELSKKLY